MEVKQWLGEDNILGQDIWHKKYQYNNETFDEWLDRVSGGNESLRQLIKEKKFLFGGRALTNRGTNYKGSMFNCYSSGYVEDDMESIMQLNTNLALTYKAQGGQGVSLTKLRPKGTPIGDEFQSDGIVPFMEMFNVTTASISQGGARKGALMMSIDITHKEASTFITIKTNEDNITKANLSLEIDDEFMTAVQEYYINGETITLHQIKDYNGHKVEYDIVPIELYKLMIKTVYDWGEPGCIFTDRFRNYNLMENDDEYQIETCNPCGEQPLPKNFSCNLGSLNLAEFVTNKYTKNAEFNWKEFKTAIKIAVNALDTIIDENLDKHALKEQSENSKNYRNIGLGVMGYGTMLFELGITYGSEKAKAFTKKLFSEMFRNSVNSSAILSSKKGHFPMYKECIWESEIIQNNFNEREIEELKELGLRNCSLLSIAPTGSIATMLGVTGGCEPEFALKYNRRTENLKESYDVFSNAINEYWKCTDDKIYNGDIKTLPSYFITSKDVKWRDRVDIQAIMQNSVDTAISSTINLDKDMCIEEAENIYLYAWSKGLKGITVYRSGSKREGILTTETKSDANKAISHDCNNNLQRGVIMDVCDDLIGYKRKLITGCGSLHLESYFDELNGEPQETFINIGSSGGCERNYQFISRLISTALRGGIPIEAIFEQSQSIRPCTSYMNRTKSKGDTSKGTSCPSAIGFALRELYDKMKERCFSTIDEMADYVEEEFCEIAETYGDYECKNCGEYDSAPKCPECGEPIRFEGGCVCCKNCGWSKCD